MRKILSSPFLNETKIIHRVSDGETLTDIALLYRTTPRKIIELNCLIEEPVKNCLLCVERGKRIYLVRADDTVGSVSAKTGVPAEELLRLNGEENFFPFSIIELP